MGTTGARQTRLLAAVASAAALLWCAFAPSAAAAPSEPLGHAGRWITDAEGKVVILHGFNTVPLNESTLPRDMGMDTDNAEWLAANGFNTIRLGLYYARVEPQPGVYDDAYLDDYLRVQGELAEKGIFTLLDMHQDQLNPRYGTGGPIPSRGFPDWFLREDGFPNTATPYPRGYFDNPALNRAYDNIWQDFQAPDGTSVQDHFAAGWRRIAAAFKNRPGLLGYDFFNEPWPGSAAAACANPAGCPPGGFDQTLLTAFNRKLVGALRAEDPAHLIFYEPNLQFDFGAQTQVGDPQDPNAGFSFHDYCLSAVAPGFPDPQPCEEGERLVLENAEAHSARTGDALLLSELGFTLAAADRMMALTDEHMMSWQWWDYHGDDLRSTHIAALPALIRPYPQLVAGTPQHFSFDRNTKVFELEYSTARADGTGSFPADSRTEVHVPARQYPDGYAVEVDGAEVTSAPGARILTLATCPGAELVTVRVTTSGGRPKSCFGYARPVSATPTTVRLVPAYEECASGNATHGPPHSSSSCNPPRQSSRYLTVGTPEANGKPASSTGSVTLKVVGESPINPANGDQADVQITTAITDVRNQSDLSDYTGELEVVLDLRITDRYNGTSLDDPATVTDAPLSFVVPCSATSGPTGSACNLATTADAVLADVAREGQRAIWELGQLKVYDGGADGDTSTADNTLFAVQGAFAP